MASAVAAMVLRFPFSNSLTVDNPTCARRANSCCVQFSQARAARHCSELIMPRDCQIFWTLTTFLVAIDHLNPLWFGSANLVAPDARSLPSLSQGPDALAGLYSAHGRGRGPRQVLRNPLVRERRPTLLPALRRIRHLYLYNPAHLQMQGV